jgi:hypothetical protein
LHDVLRFDENAPIGNREAVMSALARKNTKAMRIFRTSPHATYEQLMLREQADRRRDA